jgi:hypothetical protein
VQTVSDSPRPLFCIFLFSSFLVIFFFSRRRC